MNCPSHCCFFRLALALTVGTGLCASAQESVYHTFTDKKGQALNAALLSITPDHSKAKIQLKDGRGFELSILTLSLDDQQFVKDWLKTTSIHPDFNLEITVTRHQDNSERISVPGYQMKWLTDNTAMEIKVRNLSRADLKGATVEYYVVIEQGVHAFPRPEPEFKKKHGVGAWWYPNEAGEFPGGRNTNNGKAPSEKPLWLVHGTAKLKDLAYNYEATLKTDIFPLREIDFETRDNPNDTILGVIVRISGADGKEISVYRSTDNKVLKKSWDEIAAMPPGNSTGAPPPSKRAKP
jgi:hypothetical protein